MEILITGGSGFLGTHICVELLKIGHTIIIIDNLSNSSSKAIDRVLELTGVEQNKIIFYQANVEDRKVLQNIFDKHNISSVIHLAGFKSVNESTEQPLEYYSNNIGSGIILLEEMNKADVKNIVFSSSCSVYSTPLNSPISENSPTGNISSPYGHSKYCFETILKDIFKSDNSWNIVILRYFNPAGAHPSGMIGESPTTAIPNNLMPYICQTAHDNKKLQLHGDDYPTNDGTGVRDYIHVVDLALGHVVAMEFLENHTATCETVNLGRGEGVSVLEMVNAFKKVSGRELPYEFLERRKGDVAEVYADVNYAKEIFDWSAQYDLEKMCLDSWNWKCKNPYGYKNG